MRPDSTRLKNPLQRAVPALIPGLGHRLTGSSAIVIPVRALIKCARIALYFVNPEGDVHRSSHSRARLSTDVDSFWKRLGERRSSTFKDRKVKNVLRFAPALCRGSHLRFSNLALFHKYYGWR
jgi:hypothetical protein